MISSFCTSGNCVQVDAAPDGGVYVRRRVTGDGAGTVQLRFTAAEWEAFLLGVLAGEFTREALRGSERLPNVPTLTGTPNTPCAAVTSDLRGPPRPSQDSGGTPR